MLQNRNISISVCKQEVFTLTANSANGGTLDLTLATILSSVKSLKSIQTISRAAKIIVIKLSEVVVLDNGEPPPNAIFMVPFQSCSMATDSSSK